MHFMPHRFVRNARDLELSMCGQCARGEWEFMVIGSKIRKIGVDVCERRDMGRLHMR